MMTVTNIPKKISIIPANPAGNKTIFVTTPVERKVYQEVASFLLSLEEYEAEQVAFILEDGSMEMCGLEFCGNASRTFALIKAKMMELTGCHEIGINVSGCDRLLQVEVDTDTNYTKIEMPVPLRVIEYNGDTLVDMGGIMHLVTTDKTADPETFSSLKDSIMTEFEPPAMGVMFYDSEKSGLTPVVYVADVDTTYFEGSCGSGTVAVAAAMIMDKPDGEYRFNIEQPKGHITAVIKKRQNEIQSVSIEGPVMIGEPVIISMT